MRSSLKVLLFASCLFYFVDGANFTDFSSRRESREELLDSIIHILLSVRKFIGSLKYPIESLRLLPTERNSEDLQRLESIEERAFDATEQFIQSVSGEKISKQKINFDPEIVREAATILFEEFVLISIEFSKFQKFRFGFEPDAHLNSTLFTVFNLSKNYPS